MTALPELSVSPKHELPRTGNWLAPREFAFDGSPPPAAAAAAGLGSSASMPALKLPTLSPTSPHADTSAASAAVAASGLPRPSPRFLDGHVRPRYSSAGVQLVVAMEEKRRQRTLIDRGRPMHPPACVVRGPTHTKGRLSSSAIGAGVHLQEEASTHAVAVVPPRSLSTSALGSRLPPQRGGGRGQRQRQPLEAADAAVVLAAEERLTAAHAKYDVRRRRVEEEAAAKLSALASAQEHARNVEAGIIEEQG